jgi:hypothetical protein
MDHIKITPSCSAHAIFVTKINNKILPTEEETKSRLYIRDSKARVERNTYY